MQWQDVPNSPLWGQLKARKLAHPTSCEFNARAWKEAVADLDAETQRDTDLAACALHYGEELASLRRYVPLLTEGLSRARLVRLAAAYANQQFLTLQKKVHDNLRAERKKTGIFDLERVQQQFVANAGDQQLTADDHVTYLVDSLPHWLFHIAVAPKHALVVSEPVEVTTFAVRAMAIASAEHSLRQLWLSALWEGNALVEREDSLIEGPRDRSLAEGWFMWDLRQHMLLAQLHGQNVGDHILTGGKLPPVKPAFTRTVIRIEWPKSEHRRFIIGNTSGAKPEQRGHVIERDTLERQYIGLFLDEPLPLSPDQDFTCRELNTAWWVLQDLGRVAVKDLGPAWMSDDQAIGRFSIGIERSDLAQVLASCLEVGSDRAGQMVDWFTCDVTDTGKLFAKSFWSRPLLPAPDSDRRYLLLAPLLVGAPVKRIEAWMERGGISDSNGVKGRGKPFERHVRTEIAAALAGNQLLDDVAVAEHGLKRKGDTEEIDLLVRIGNSVLIGEIKCFVAPSEPTEKFNHLKNLGKAARQCAKKRDWADKNRTAIAEALGISDPVRVAKLAMIPVVVINNGMGIGLDREGVPIVDLHYLRLVLSAGSYRSAARFEHGVGIKEEIEVLYRCQADLEASLPGLLLEPVALKRYTNAFRWRRMPFPVSDGRKSSSSSLLS